MRRLCAMRHPVFYALNVQAKLFCASYWIIKTKLFNKTAVTAIARVCSHNTIERALFCPVSLKSQFNHRPILLEAASCQVFPAAAFSRAHCSDGVPGPLNTAAPATQI